MILAATSFKQQHLPDVNGTRHDRLLVALMWKATMTLMTSDVLSLFGEWPKTHVQNAGLYVDKADLHDHEGGNAVLEMKSLPPQPTENAGAAGSIDGPDALWRLLNEMTVEMREQFRFFRELREGAGGALEAAADEVAGKAARADVKAATDAVSLIVRTLEKIDTLQRQLSRDREVAAQSEADNRSYEEAVAFFQRRIDELVEQKMRARLVAAGLSPEGCQADGRE